MNADPIHPGYHHPTRHADRRCRECFHLTSAPAAPDGQCFGTEVQSDACCDLFTERASVSGFVPSLRRAPVAPDGSES